MKLGLRSKKHFSRAQERQFAVQPSAGLVVIRVDPSYQGRGYGSLILKEFERVAVENYAIGKLKLSVRADNANAIRAYEKNGWKRDVENEDSLSMFKYTSPLK